MERRAEMLNFWAHEQVFCRVRVINLDFLLGAGSALKSQVSLRWPELLFVAVACTLFMGAVKKRNLKMQGNGFLLFIRNARRLEIWRKWGGLRSPIERTLFVGHLLLENAM